MIRYTPLLLTLALAVGASQCEAVLVAHYEFDNSSNVGLDTAGGDNNGTSVGADSSYSGTSRVGSGALALDGTGLGLRLDNPADFQSLTTFTIAAFVRPDLNSVTWGGGSVNIGRIFGSVGVDSPGGVYFGDGGGYGFGLKLIGEEAGLRFTTFAVKDYDVNPDTLANPLLDDEWAHVAVVVTEGAAEFFINGVSVATDTGNNGNPTTNPYHIGAGGGGNSDSYAGLLDDLRVYNEALDVSTIAGLASPGDSGQKGLVVTVDRGTGNISLTNDTSSGTEIRGYSLTSAASRFDSGEWQSISENYDQGNGSASIDTNDDWLIFSQTADDLSEGTTGETMLSTGQSVMLGSAWRKGPFEGNDIQAEVLLADGTTMSAVVEYTGNGDSPFIMGDGLVD
ncbi:LamG domain-containing protein [Aeoliella mucimassa]|uniref:LamG-like jellyroll fold domain-containing protein n=1 Tax=Aeoliella mucimassa TaxID=2527972 RepID=A0A518AQ62_9BACT|nr:LamG domain-containing protein [Aeoliella mucimassa]QDU56854.1 hypothetical protein Pan181_30660 [Aeoliella mucimassa]